VFVDHGLLREGEAEQVEKDFVAATGVDLVVVDAADRFLARARRGERPGGEAQDHRPRVHPGLRAGRARRRRRGAAEDHPVEFLVQGTLYPDVVESGGGTGTANIKSHHNVGGLPDDLQFKLVEPLRDLFKDEVRQVGLELGVPEAIVWRQPFPGPGWASASSARSPPSASHPARRRRHRPRGADGGRARPLDLAVPGRAAGRRPLGRGAGRRPHLRPPDRAAPGVARTP
jgi:GMP synthase (glutamine-hydrolysing)